MSDDILVRIEQEERRLRMTRFDADAAWAIVLWLREAARARNLPIAVDVFANGMTVAAAAMPGSRPDNAEWIRRKRNLTLRTHRSSRATEIALERAGLTLEQRTGAAPRDYAAAGGSVPIHVEGVGVIGAVTVSGLTSEADHALAIESLQAVLGAGV